MIKVGRITFYFIFLFAKQNIIAYQKIKKNSTLDTGYRTRVIHRYHSPVEYPLYSATDVHYCGS